MYLKVLGKPRLNEEKGLWQSTYYVFKTDKKRLTTKTLEKIRLFLTKKGEERYSRMSLEVLKTWFVTQYETLQQESENILLEGKGIVSYHPADHIILVDLDQEA